MTRPTSAGEQAELNLFVYGTLAPGRPNAHVLADVDGTWQPATVRGHLHAHGWGSTLGFPVLVLDDSAPVVSGLLFTSDELPARWQQLDDFEGSGYARVTTRARTQDGSDVAARVYVHNPTAL